MLGEAICILFLFFIYFLMDNILRYYQNNLKNVEMAVEGFSREAAAAGTSSYLLER